MVNILNPKPAQLILDAGCGSGNVTKYLHEIGCIGVGIDYSEAAIKIAQNQENGLFIRASVTALPFRSRIFDGIVSISMWEHIDLKDKLKFLSEASRVMKWSGGLSGNTVNVSFPMNLALGIYSRLEHLGLVSGQRDTHPGEEGLATVQEHLSQFFERVDTWLVSYPIPKNGWFKSPRFFITNMIFSYCHFFPRSYSSLRYYAKGVRENRFRRELPSEKSDSIRMGSNDCCD